MNCMHTYHTHTQTQQHEYEIRARTPSLDVDNPLPFRTWTLTVKSQTQKPEMSSMLAHPFSGTARVRNFGRRTWDGGSAASRAPEVHICVYIVDFVCIVCVFVRRSACMRMRKVHVMMEAWRHNVLMQCVPFVHVFVLSVYLQPAQGTCKVVLVHFWWLGFLPTHAY